MFLRIAFSPLSPLCFSISKSSYSQISTSSRSPALLVRCNLIKLSPIWCSITQVNSYGTVASEKRPALKWNSLYRRISTVKNPNPGAAAAVLDQWDEQKTMPSKWDFCRVAKELRKFRRFRQALEVYDWMSVRAERFKLTSSDMAIKLDLISRLHGISAAEEYFSALPDELRDKFTYDALLNVYGRSKMKEKAENLLETMKTNGYVNDVFPLNVMMTIYMNFGEHERVSEIINEMKEKNLRFDLYYYNMWMTNCAAMEKFEEMERVLGRMISDRVSPNWTTYSTLASMYIKARNFEKAEEYLKEVELRVTGRDRTPFHYLLGYYCRMGKKEEVYRIWNLYKSNFRTITNIGYRAVLSSLVKLKDIEGAEAIYDEWLSATSNFDKMICKILINYYLRHGDFEKAKLLLDRFVEKREKRDKPRPIITWENLAEGYLSKMAKL